jgi:hypothetical protein
VHGRLDEYLVAGEADQRRGRGTELDAPSLASSAHFGQTEHSYRRMVNTPFGHGERSEATPG